MRRHGGQAPHDQVVGARQIAEGRNLGASLDGAADRMDPELKKNVWDRKGFDKRLSKFSNEKGSQEFKDWSYELRRVTVSDPNFHSFLRWLEEEKLEGTQGAVTEQVLENLGAKTGCMESLRKPRQAELKHRLWLRSIKTASTERHCTGPSHMSIWTAPRRRRPRSALRSRSRLWRRWTSSRTG